MIEQNLLDKIEIISVNYNTPDLIDKMIKSIRNLEGNYKIRIIDGSDREPFKTDIVNVCNNYSNVVLEQQGWNIHHGRGMDLGVSTSKFDWCLILDSDVYLIQPMIEKMYKAVNNTKKIVAEHCHVNKHGLAISKNYSKEYPIKYYHPSLFLINVNYYKELKSNNITFIHHGAPNIKIMTYLYEKNLSDIVGADVFEYHNISFDDIPKWKYSVGRGTVNRFGYSL